MVEQFGTTFEADASRDGDAMRAWKILRVLVGVSSEDLEPVVAGFSAGKPLPVEEDKVPSSSSTASKGKGGGGDPNADEGRRPGKHKRPRSKSSTEGNGDGRSHGRSTVLSQEVRQMYIEWCRENTMMRGDSLTTSFRAVAAFISKMLGKCQGVDPSTVKPLSLAEAQEFVEKYQPALNEAARESLNSSLATFWRHFLRFLADAGNPPILAPPLGPGMMGGREGVKEVAKATAVAAGASGDGGVVGGLGEGGEEEEDVSYEGMSFEEEAGFDEEVSDGWGVIPGAMAGGKPHGPLGSVNVDQSPSLRGLASAAALYKGGRGQQQGAMSAKKPTRNRVTPYVINPPTRQAFTAWMMRNTRMQGASMMTAMRTANRVVAQLLLKHSVNKAKPGDPNRFVEHTFDELRALAEVHGDDVTRELEKTASMSIQTFWRHFARFLMGQEETNPTNGPSTVVNTRISETGTAPPNVPPVSSGMANPHRPQPEPIFPSPSAPDPWYMKDRWGNNAGPSPPVPIGPSPVATANVSSFAPLSLQHVEQIKRGEVIDSRILQKFEAWLAETCYVPSTNAWAHCRDLNEGIRMVLSREGKGMFVPDMPSAFAFLKTFEQHPLMAERSRVVKRFHDFLLHTMHRGAVPGVTGI